MSDDRSNKEIFKAAILAELKRQKESEEYDAIYWDEDNCIIDGVLEIDKLVDAVENAMVNAQMGRG